MFTPIQLNVPRIERWETFPERVEALLLTENNLDEAAKWCGGVPNDSGKPSDPSDIYKSVKVPSLTGVFNVSVGEYLVRDLETGRFSGKTKAGFESRFHKVGVRHDGHAINTTSRGSGESYGHYADPRYQMIPDPAISRGGSIEPKGWGKNSDSP